MRARLCAGWILIDQLGCFCQAGKLVLDPKSAEELREVLRGALSELDAIPDAEVAIEDLTRDARTPLAPFQRG